MDAELIANMKSGNYTVITADGEVLRSPSNPHGIIVVLKDGDLTKPMLRITDTSDDEVANLSFRYTPEGNMQEWEPDDESDRNFQLLTVWS